MSSMKYMYGLALSVFLAALLLASGCGGLELSPDDPLELIELRSACVNGWLGAFRIGDVEFTAMVRHAPAQVEIVDGQAGTREQFDMVYNDCNMYTLFKLQWPRKRRDYVRPLFPDRPVAGADKSSGGGLAVDFKDGGQVIVEGKGLSWKDEAHCMVRLLEHGEALMSGYFPAIRLRQEIRGEWRDVQHFCIGSFNYVTAPENRERYSFTAFPLEIGHYTDRTELRVVDAASTPIRVRIKEGFAEIWTGFKPLLVDTLLRPGEPYRFELDYKFRGGSDIWFQVERLDDAPDGSFRDVSSNVNLYGPSKALSYAKYGSKTWEEHVTRSEALNRAMQYEGVPYPSGHLIPDWAKERLRELTHRKERLFYWQKRPEWYEGRPATEEPESSRSTGSTHGDTP